MLFVVSVRVCVRVGREVSLGRLLMLSRFGYSRIPPPSATPCFRMYNGRAVASPTAIPANAGDATREWKTLLTKFQIADDAAEGLVKYIVESEVLASFDDFRCNFRESTDFRAELVAKAEMPDGHTAIDKPGFHGARLRQVWPSKTSAPRVPKELSWTN